MVAFPDTLIDTSEFAPMPTKQWLLVEVDNEIVMHLLPSFISNFDFKPLFVPIKVSIFRYYDDTKCSKTNLERSFISSRCEVRRVQDPSDSNGGKTAFILRNFDIQKGRRWTGHYFFYNDQDCMEPAYGLEFAGHVTTKGDNISFSFDNLKIAPYKTDVDKLLHRIYNVSCPGAMKPAQSAKNANPHVYNADKGVGSECVKALGVDLEEFNSAYIQSHSLKQNKVVGLLLQSPNLRKGSPQQASKSFQWALGRHTSMCLTCTKARLASIGHPPRLLARNVSSVDGAWASSYCSRQGSVHMSRFDKFDGNKFESTVLVYYNSLCVTPDVELSTMGTIQRVSDSVEVPGGVVYKLMVRNAFLTSYMPSLTRVLSVNKKNCGGQDWTNGKTQNLMSTKGCNVIGSNFNGPELVLIRTVRDERHNEMYFGTDSPDNKHKSGPVNYNYVNQDCKSFPLDVPTPPPTPAKIATALPTWPTRANTLRQKEEVGFVEGLSVTLAPSGGALPAGSTPNSLLSCLFVVVFAALKFV